MAFDRELGPLCQRILSRGDCRRAARVDNELVPAVRRRGYAIFQLLSLHCTDRLGSLCDPLVGTGFGGPVLIIFSGAFAPCVIGSYEGGKLTDIRLLEAARTVGAGGVRIITDVILPSAVPSIVAAMRVAAGNGWQSLVGAELIVASSGVAYTMVRGQIESYHYGRHGRDDRDRHRGTNDGMVVSALGGRRGSPLRITSHSLTRTTIKRSFGANMGGIDEVQVTQASRIAFRCARDGGARGGADADQCQLPGHHSSASRCKSPMTRTGGPRLASSPGT